MPTSLIRSGAGGLVCLVVGLLVGCSTTTSPEEGTDGGVGSDGGTMSTVDSGGGGGGTGACGTTSTTCSIDVCPAGSDCTASGVSAGTVACSTPIAQPTQGGTGNTIAIIPCDATLVPSLAIELTGIPAVGTYDSSSAVIANSGIFCAGSLTGDAWIAGPESAEDGGAIGTFTLTLTSVTAVMDVQAGETVYDVHGSVTAQCSGESESGETPAGVVSLTATF